MGQKMILIQARGGLLLHGGSNWVYKNTQNKSSFRTETFTLKILSQMQVQVKSNSIKSTIHSTLI